MKKKKMNYKGGEAPLFRRVTMYQHNHGPFQSERKMKKGPWLRGGTR